MRFDVGDKIRNKVTQEDGQVVRIADTSVGRVYIVSIALDQPWCATPREALWRESEVKRTEVE